MNNIAEYVFDDNPPAEYKRLQGILDSKGNMKYASVQTNGTNTVWENTSFLRYEDKFPLGVYIIGLFAGIILGIMIGVMIT